MYNMILGVSTGLLAILGVAVVIWAVVDLSHVKPKGRDK